MPRWVIVIGGGIAVLILQYMLTGKAPLALEPCLPQRFLTKET